MKAAATSKKSPIKTSAQGPTLFEVEYLRQLKEELEVFLKSRNFGTIREVNLAFAGQDYKGSMRVSA